MPGIFFDINPAHRRDLFESPCHHFVRISFGPPLEVLDKGSLFLPPKEYVHRYRSAFFRSRCHSARARQSKYTWDARLRSQLQEIQRDQLCAARRPCSLETRDRDFHNSLVKQCISLFLTMYIHNKTASALHTLALS